MDTFTSFKESVDARYHAFIQELHEELTKQLCTCTIKSAKSGYVVSYVRKDNKKTLATFVCRKSGVKLRIFAEHIQTYMTYLDELPIKLKKEIKKASVCKRLLNPNDCNQKCTMGYTFTMDGEAYKKCRYMAFLLSLSEENDPYIKQLVLKEAACV